MTSSGLISEPKKAPLPNPGSGPLGKSGPTMTKPSGGPVQSGARSPGIIYNFNYLLTSLLLRSLRNSFIDLYYLIWGILK